jgi:hypothetical protein
LYRVWRFAQNVQREVERQLPPDAELSTLRAEWEENNFADGRSGVLRGWNVRLHMRAVCVNFDKADCRPSCNSTLLKDVR